MKSYTTMTPNNMNETPKHIERHKRKFAVWFHSYEVQQKENLIYNDRNQNGRYLWRVGIDWKGHEEAFLGAWKFHHLEPSYGYKCTFVKIHQAMHLKFVCFIICITTFLKSWGGKQKQKNQYIL